MLRNWQPWTTEEEQILIRLHVEGISIQQQARIMGCNVKGISAKRHKLGLKFDDKTLNRQSKELKSLMRTGEKERGSL